MNRRLLIVGVGAALLVMSAAPSAEPQARFRSGRTIVSVNASVTGREPGSPLTAADFVLTDNGVRQQVEAIAIEAVPIDVTLIVDTSGSAARGIRQLMSDVEALARRLRPIDRFRLLSIDTYVNEILPLRSPGPVAWPRRIPFNGASAVYDAVVAAMLTPVDIDRRHLIVAMTDGADTISALDAESVRDVAGRSDVLLHVVLFSLPAAPPPVPPNWLPRRERDLGELDQATRITGGQIRRAETLGSHVLEALEAVLEEFRRSYVLRYTPAGVRPNGWHAIDVTLARGGQYKIHARKGYFGG